MSVSSCWCASSVSSVNNSNKANVLLLPVTCYNVLTVSSVYCNSLSLALPPVARVRVVCTPASLKTPVPCSMVAIRFVGLAVHIVHCKFTKTIHTKLPRRSACLDMLADLYYR
jgi:hypothetical protein